MEKKDWIILVFIFTVVLVLFHPFLGVYFSGDDFFHFRISGFHSLGEFVKFFHFLPIKIRGYAFYRPIFREVLFGVYYKIFGLESAPFRIFQLIIHFANIALVYLFFKKLFNEKLALFTSFFFGISAANVGVLYYLAGGVQGSGALLFSLLSLIFFSNKKKFWSFVFFLLALMSHEMAVALLPLLIALQLLRGWIPKWRQFAPHALTVAVYLFLNFKIIGFSESEVQYSPVFSIKSILNTLAWYKVWALGMPEMLVDFVKSGLKLDLRLMQYWGNYYKIIFPAFFASIGLIAISFLKNLKVIKEKKFWFFVLWFMAGIFIFLFLPVHKKYYYLALSLPAFWGIVWLLVSKSSRVIIVGLVVSLVALNATSIKLGDETYWAAKRGRIAKSLVSQIKTTFPSLPKGTALYIKNDPNYPTISGSWGGSSTQAKIILNDSDALRLLYDDPRLEVYYEDMQEKPEGQLFETMLIIKEGF